MHPDAHAELNPVARYDLVANVCHEGRPVDGKYKVHVLHQVSNMVARYRRSCRGLCSKSTCSEGMRLM